MSRVVLLMCLSVCGIVNADHEAEVAILKRLEATERLVQKLFDEVASLKDQDQLQKEQISEIKKQLHVQQQRNTQLERLNKRLTSRKVSSRKVSTNFLKDEGVLVRQLYDSDTRNDVSIERKRRAGNDSPVAFFAKMDINFEHARTHQNFVFEVIVANVGNAYNNQTGAFVAPVSGYYLFTTTIASFYHNNARVQFVKNGQAVTNMFINGVDPGDSTSQTIILPLLLNDIITVQNLESDKSFIGGSHSTFSGFLLFDTHAHVGK